MVTVSIAMRRRVPNHFDAGYAKLSVDILNEYFDSYFPRAAQVGAQLRAAVPAAGGGGGDNYNNQGGGGFQSAPSPQAAPQTGGSFDPVDDDIPF